MGFAEIRGQQRVVRLLRRALGRGHLPHALLFTGTDGVGKRLTAFTLAKALNCESGIGECCECCLSCRKAASGNHPDITTIECEGTVIKIEQIRALQQSLRFRPLEGRCRAVIIPDAQNLKTEAANALLKVLEEPPADNVIILTSLDTSALPSTIVSRCLHLRFQPLSAADIADYLLQTQAASPEQAGTVAALAGGSLSRALSLVDEEELSCRRWLLETVAGLDRPPAAEILTTTDISIF
jgi:DNA polymerase-3 subunit delta'